LPADLFKFHEAPGDYLAFLGRISPEKRVDRAIEIARRVGAPLKIAAKVDRVDQDYFDAVIKPMLDPPLVEFVGEIGGKAKEEFLGKAFALLFPIDWPEPFGLVMIEAMACGTPVIAWDRGAVPEIIEDGVTGFIVNSIDEAVDAISRLPTLRRDIVRSTFERRFSASTMAGKYVELYRHLLPCEGVPAPQRSAVAAT
jgi:glycosyltransferase involved in cell wall biosynthesis